MIWSFLTKIPIFGSITFYLQYLEIQIEKKNKKRHFSWDCCESRENAFKIVAPTVGIEPTSS
jgi:hypothetical protein